MPIFLHLIYILLIVVLLTLFLRYRERLHRVLGRYEGDPIPTSPLHEFDDRFRMDELGPTLEAEVRFIGGAGGVLGGTTDTEAWVLAVLAKGARTLFEFGTATGRTTCLWARNTPEDASITTITLAPDQHGGYAAGEGDNAAAGRQALSESAHTRFRYEDAPEGAKVRQLFGDSKELDPAPYAGRCDLIFIDGSHAYSYVKSDTEKAMRMVAPGGVILWHDYRGRGGKAGDVYRYLNELSRELPLVHLRGTAIIGWRAPRLSEAALEDVRAA